MPSDAGLQTLEANGGGFVGEVENYLRFAWRDSSHATVDSVRLNYEERLVESDQRQVESIDQLARFSGRLAARCMKPLWPMPRDHCQHRFGAIADRADGVALHLSQERSDFGGSKHRQICATS
jgi:hypothetical protein